MRDRFNERPQNFVGNTPHPQKNYKEDPREGEFEETRNLNEEMNKILNRLNSGSQIGLPSQASLDSQNINKKRSSHDYIDNNDENNNINKRNNQNYNNKNEGIDLNKVRRFLTVVI